MEKKYICKFKLFLHRGISTVHKYSCMANIICKHVLYMVITLHTICEGLTIIMHILPTILQSKGNQTMRFDQVVEYKERNIFS